MDKNRQQLPAAIGSKLMSQVERFASTTSRKAASIHPAVILENENRRNAVNIILGHRERSDQSADSCIKSDASFINLALRWTFHIFRIGNALQPK